MRKQLHDLLYERIRHFLSATCLMKKWNEKKVVGEAECKACEM